MQNPTQADRMPHHVVDGNLPATANRGEEIHDNTQEIPIVKQQRKNRDTDLPELRIRRKPGAHDLPIARADDVRSAARPSTS